MKGDACMNEQPSLWRGPFLPLLFLTLAFLARSGFESAELARQETLLASAQTALQPKLEQARRIRAQLDAIARETAILARQGNPNARELVDELAKNGITINIDAGAASANP
jgi:hypothetical protein